MQNLILVVQLIKTIVKEEALGRVLKIRLVYIQTNADNRNHRTITFKIVFY
jgi:hypothetical protein